MSNINMTQWAADIKANPRRVAVPIMTHPGIELCGATVQQAVTDGAVHADAICRLNAAHPAAACTAIMDLTVEAEAFGAHVLFAPDEVPNVTGRLVDSPEAIAALPVPDLSAGRVPQYLEANRLVASRVTDKPIFGGCIGPFSLAGRLFDMSEMMMALYTDPDAIRQLLQKCADFIKAYVAAMKAAGIHGVIMAEPAAGLISNDDCQTFSTDYIRPIVEELQDDSFMIVLHNCGNTGHCTRAMVQSGAAALHFGNQADMVQALKDCPADVLVMGNIDPVSVMQQATPEAVEARTLQLLQDTAAWPNFVLSTGCDVPPHTPEDNIRAFYRALDAFNANR